MTPLATRRRYVIERTTYHGHWFTHAHVYSNLQAAVRDARRIAAWVPSYRRRVTVRVRALQGMPNIFATWINGHPASGRAFR